MRLLLDAHVSGPCIGRWLEAEGHDVRALDQDPMLEGMDDEEVLSAAAADERILVTHNTRDFPAILREWAAAQRPHAAARRARTTPWRRAVRPFATPVIVKLTSSVAAVTTT